MVVKRKASHARASLLDRLIDLEPDIQQEQGTLRALPIQEWRQAFFRDLEWLLNTYCPIGYSELTQRQRSVIDYGIVDFSTFFANNSEDYFRLAKLLEETINIYEPRLKEVRITVLGDPQHQSHSELKVGLDARVDATLLIDQLEEPISFIIHGDKEGELKVVPE